MRLDGKVSIITGAAKGLGLDIARLYAANGSKVIVTDINDHDGLLESEKIQSKGNLCSFWIRVAT